MGVNDRQEGLLKTRLDGRRHALAAPQFLANALEDQDVGIDRHANQQDEAGDAGQGQHSLEVSQRRHHHHQVQYQGQNRVDARSSVIEEHEANDRGQPDDARQQAAPDRIGAQRSAHGALFQVGDAGGQRARLQHQRQVAGPLTREVPGDPAAVRNPALDNRHGVDLVVQHDGHGVAHVGLGVTAEALGAVGLDREIDLRLGVLILPDPRAAQVAPGDDRSARDDVPLLSALGLGGAAVAVHRLQNHGPFRQHAAAGDQRGLRRGIRLRILDLLDLQHGGGLDDLLDPCRIIDAGQLHQDLALAAADLADVGLGEAQLVDAPVDGLQRLLDRVVLQRRHHAGLHPQRPLVSGCRSIIPGPAKALVQQVAKIARPVGRHALDRDVLGVGDLHLVVVDVVFLQHLLEPVGRLAGFGRHRFLHVHLQHQVRTALQVQAQTDTVGGRLPGLRPSPGKPENPEHAGQNDSHDENAFVDKVSFHIPSLMWISCPRRPAARPRHSALFPGGCPAGVREGGGNRP